MLSALIYGIPVWASKGLDEQVCVHLRVEIWARHAEVVLSLEYLHFS